MMTAAVVLAALAIVAWWICASVIRMALAGGLAALTHPAPPAWLVVVLAVVLVTVAVVIVWRALAPSGGRLIFATKPFAAVGHIST
jgi:hypothetical protein